MKFSTTVTFPDNIESPEQTISQKEKARRMPCRQRTSINKYNDLASLSRESWAIVGRACRTRGHQITILIGIRRRNFANL